MKYKTERTVAAIQRMLGWVAFACAGIALVPTIAGDLSPVVPAVLGIGGLGLVASGSVIDLLIDIQASTYATASNIATLIDQTKKRE
jgi:hypothetical protein